MSIGKMTTELRQQLSAIAMPDVVTKRKATLLFTQDEARNQTIETVYNIGKNGLYELIRMDPNFIRFDTTLFGIKMRSMDRFLETEKVNDELNKNIHDFLCSLSPYMMLKASQKCLEYLFRHFYIHLMNVSDLILSVLPYHETSLFPKIVSLLEIEGDPHWYFLSSIKRSKAPLLRQYIGSQCSKDQGLLELILNYISENTKEDYNMNLHYTFISALLFDYTKIHQIQESEIRLLLSFIQTGMKCIQNKEFQCTSYLLFCHLCSMITLDSTVLTTLLQSMFKYPRPDTIESILQTFLILRKSNKISQEVIDILIQNHDLDSFLSVDSLVYHWKTLSDQYDCSSLLSLFLKPTLQLFIEKKQNYEFLQLLYMTMKEEQLSEYFQITVEVLESLLNQYQGQEELKRIESNVNQLLRYIASKYTTLFDTLWIPLSMSTVYLSSSIQNLFNGGEHMIFEKGMSLYTALHQDDLDIRQRACKAFLELLPNTKQELDSSQSSFYQSSVLDLLHDSDASIVSLLLSLDTDRFLLLFSPSSFLQELYLLLQSPLCSQNTKANKKLIQRILIHIEFIGFDSTSYPILLALKSLLLYIPYSSHLHSLHKPVLSLLSKLPITFCKHLDSFSLTNTSYIDLYTVFAKNIKEDPTNLEICFEFLQSNESLPLCFLSLHILMVYITFEDISTSLLPIYDQIFFIISQYIKNNQLSVSKSLQLPTSFYSPARTVPKIKKEIVFSCYECLLELIQHINYSLYSLNPLYGELPSNSSHPIQILILLLLLKSKNESVNLLIDQLQQHVSKAISSPYALYLSTLSISTMYDGVFEEILRKIQSSLSELTLEGWNALFSHLLFFLCNENKNLRIFTLQIYEYLLNWIQKLEIKEVEDSKQLLSYIVSLKSEIIHDSQYFPTTMNALFLKNRPTVAVETCIQYNNVVLEILLQNISSQYLKSIGFSMLRSLSLYKEEQFQQVLDFLSHVFEKEEIHLYDVRLFKSLLRIFFSSIQKDISSSVSCAISLISSILAHPQSYSYKNIKKQRTDTILPISEVLSYLNASLYTLFPLEKQSIFFHQIYCLLLTSCPLESTEVYQCIDRLHLPLSLFFSEIQHYIQNQYPEFSTFMDKVNALTVFVEVYRHTSTKTELEGLQPFIELLKWFIQELKEEHLLRDPSILLLNFEEKEISTEATTVSQQEKNIGSTSMDVELYNQSISYLLQSILETLYDILSAHLDSIQDPSLLDPSLLISCLQITSSIQVLHFILRILSLCCESQTEIFFPHLYQCLKQLVSLVFLDLSNNYEYIQILFHILSTCGPYLKKKPQYIFQLFQILIPCILYMPIQSAKNLSNQLIKAISVRYLSHFILYLLCIYNGSTMDGIHMEESELLISISNHLYKIPIERHVFYSFILDILSNYPIKSQIQCILFIIASCEAIPYGTEDDFEMDNPLFKETIESILENIIYKVVNQENQLQYMCLYLQYIRETVMNPQFITEVSQLSKKEQSSIQNLFLNCTEYLFYLMQICNEHISTIGEDSNESKEQDEETMEITEDRSSTLSLWQQCQESIYTILNILNELMNIPAFITVITELLSNEEMSIRKRALQMLNTKLESSVTQLSTEEQSLFLDLLENIHPILSNTEESLINKQTSVLSIHVLAQYFASLYPDSFIPCLSSLIQSLKSFTGDEINRENQEQQNLLGSIYMCLTILVSKLDIKLVPYINDLLHSYFNSFESYLSLLSSTKTPNILLYQSFLTLLSSLIIYQSKFLSPYLYRICQDLFHKDLLSLSSNIIQNQLDQVFLNLAQYIKIRLLIKPLTQIYAQFHYHSLCILRFYSLLQSISIHLNASDFTSYSIQLWSLCLQGLQNRYLYKQENHLESLDAKEHSDFMEMEKGSIQCMIEVMKRLNEKQFRPLFIQFIDWIHEDQEDKTIVLDRSLPFYSFLYIFTDTLKSISISYYSSLQEQIEFILNTLSSKGKSTLLSLEEETLMIHIIDCLNLYFKYHTSEPLEESLFTLYSTLLVHCYKCISFGPSLEDYQEFILSHVCPAITELIVSTTGHDPWWKQLNYNLLLYTRDENTTVKYVSLKTIQECFTRASQDYITLIPDVIPYLANLLEDSDPQIEKLANDVKIQLETLSGEQLDSFLTI